MHSRLELNQELDQTKMAKYVDSRADQNEFDSREATHYANETLQDREMSPNDTTFYSDSKLARKLNEKCGAETPTLRIHGVEYEFFRIESPKIGMPEGVYAMPRGTKSEIDISYMGK